MAHFSGADADISTRQTAKRAYQELKIAKLYRSSTVGGHCMVANFGEASRAEEKSDGRTTSPIANIDVGQHATKEAVTSHTIH